MTIAMRVAFAFAWCSCNTCPVTSARSRLSGRGAGNLAKRVNSVTMFAMRTTSSSTVRVAWSK